MARRVQKDQLGTPLIKALFYGQAGSTKTRTSATAALDDRFGRVLMLESKGNPLSIRTYQRLPDIITMDSLTDYNAPYEWLFTGQQPGHPFARDYELQPPYHTLIIDGMTEIQRLSFKVVTNATNVAPGAFPASVEIQHFNKVLGQMVNFANLYYSLPMHVIITSLEREDKDEVTGSIMYKPLLWGQSSGEVASYAFLVARLVHRARLDNKTQMEYKKAGELHIVEDAITDATVSVALFKPSGKYIAKDQYGMGLPFMADPTMSKILDRIEQPVAVRS